MLCRLVVASAVSTHWRLLSSDAVKVAGQKRTVARPQLGNTDALASGPAKSPVCLRVGVSGEGEGAMSGRVQVAFVAGLKLLQTRPALGHSSHSPPPPPLHLRPRWLSGVMVGRRTCDPIGRRFDSGRGIIRATTLGKLFTPNVPLFTKQYNLVPCEGFHANAPYCWQRNRVQ